MIPSMPPCTPIIAVENGIPGLEKISYRPYTYLSVKTQKNPVRNDTTTLIKRATPTELTIPLNKNISETSFSSAITVARPRKIEGFSQGHHFYYPSL